MARPEPISPESPKENLDAKHQLTIAMGLAIAAIAKEKGLVITTAEIKKSSNDYQELEIKVVVKSDQETGEKYNEELRKYWHEKQQWETETLCEKFNITEEQYNETSKQYTEYCRETNYNSRINKEKFFESKHPIFVKQSEIIEVA